jgi:Tol biopolymer transport system component
MPRRRNTFLRRLAAGLIVLLLPALRASGAGAQFLTRPHLPWLTLRTGHFTVHYPAEMREWTESVARRLESVSAAVTSVVGNRPASRVTVLVEDPASVANGFAIPFLEGPVIFLWPTPPAPSPSLGAHHGWGELLAVHEYSHIAHLTIPSRNPNEQLLWKLLPAQLSPVARKSPAWVIEGYATLIEGRLTGSGRPPSAGRAAVLRQWALEGKLPTYGQLNSAGTFLGGSMRYLVGSAFLEWLEARKGDSSLVHLWRRLSAREQRSFGSAFAGVFGAPPEDLYGRFFVEVTAKALEVEQHLRRAPGGVVEGELVQRLQGGTGDPAVSPDGKRLAVVVRSRTGPSRLVVWSADAPPPDTAALRRQRQALARDPLDVPAFDSFPRPRRALATLHPASGRSHEFPRWLPDGQHLLVSRDEPLGDGAFRPDLFLWNHQTGGVRRVTRGASIRQADPAPDGRSAAGVRCQAGVCSLVVVDLSTGRWRVLAAGTPERVWHRPRWSPDGSRVAAGMHDAGRWSIAVVDVATGKWQTWAPGDGADRHSPSFLPSGQELLVVSERGGIANLEVFPLSGGAPRTLSRVTGAVLAPDVSRADGRAYFLALHAKGLDLRRMRLDAVPAGPVALSGDLAPAAPARTGRPPVRFAADSLHAASDYGFGPRRWRVLPGSLYGPDGAALTLMIGNVDPISRLGVVAQGGYGQRGTWRGASLAMALRRSPVTLESAVWYSEHHPSEQEAGSFAPPTADIVYTAAGAIARWGREGSRTGLAVRGGATFGTVNGHQLDAAGRLVALGEAQARLGFSVARVGIRMGAAGHVSTGSTDGQSWSRTLATGSLTVGNARRSFRAEGTRGAMTVAEPGEFGKEFEYFLVGGVSPPYFDRAFLSHRVTLPAVPTGFVSGRRLEMLRLSIGGLGLEPYMLWVAAGASATDWKRIAGLEREVAFPSLGFARLPAIRIRFGAGYSFDPPYQYRTRAYGSVFYSP